MDAHDPTEGWFDGVDDADDGATAVHEGSAPEPRDWPRLAVERGFAADEGEYYERLHEATMSATRSAVREQESADDQQLIHAVRALDDCQRTANELLERVAEWAASHDPDATVDVAYARELTDSDAETPLEERVRSLAARVVALDEETAALRAFVERATPGVAPNLAALAGPVLATRLIALAGGLEPLAKKPAGTVQLLGAEDALFAHLRGGAPSPKHGVIYTHGAVRETHPDDRGSAARALAGKLTIAARVDHYSGDRRPELDADLDERIERIRARESG
jgi:nucleolar protein 56